MLTTQHSSSQWLLHFVLLSLVLFGYKRRLLFSLSATTALFHFHLLPCSQSCAGEGSLWAKKINLTGPYPYQDIVKFPRCRIGRRPL